MGEFQPLVLLELLGAIALGVVSVWLIVRALR
jgi:hypothetical protein